MDLLVMLRSHTQCMVYDVLLERTYTTVGIHPVCYKGDIGLMDTVLAGVYVCKELPQGSG